jgi:putative transposase
LVCPRENVPVRVRGYTRESLTIEVGRRIKARDVFASLEHLFAVRGAPQLLRSDNGPEFVAEYDL